jgi:hypothetical protein
MTALIGPYWVGQIPSESLSIQIRDDLNSPVDLSNFTSFEVVMLDSDNNEIDLTGSTLDTSNVLSGRFIFAFPADHSVFTKRGDYLFQLWMESNGKIEKTSVLTIRVKELGGR